MAHLVPQSSLTLDDDGRLGVRTVDADSTARFLPVTVLLGRPSLAEAAVGVLSASDPADKSRRAHGIAGAWQSGELTEIGSANLPLRPARPPRPELRNPRDMPRRSKE